MAYPCAVNSAYLDFGSSASEYAVGCLPDVSFDFPASWAGQIPVQNISNDELFFWLFEAENEVESDNLISRIHSPNTSEANSQSSLAEWRSRLFVS